jgi:hypothetical protein
MNPQIPRRAYPMTNKNKPEATHRARWIMPQILSPQGTAVNRMEGEGS